MHKELSKTIEYHQRRSESQINKKRTKKSQLKERDKIYLFIKNLKISQPSRKLNYKKINLFIIKIKRSNVTFELELSKETKIHPIFHILFLESANPETPAQDKSPKLSSDNEYEIESIRDYDPETRQYIVKWKRYPQKKNTWEPIENLGNCREVIRKSEYPLEEEITVRNPGPQESVDRRPVRHYYQLRWSQRPLSRCRWVTFPR